MSYSLLQVRPAQSESALLFRRERIWVSISVGNFEMRVEFCCLNGDGGVEKLVPGCVEVLVGSCSICVVGSWS
jgi:hypothetical protein